MRCLTLADQIRESLRANIVFVCRLMEGNMIDLIRQRGFDCLELADIAMDVSVDMDDREQSNWYRIPWEQDAEEVMVQISTNKVDLLIIDHYSIGSKWQKKLKSICHKIMVIDDLADRYHDCDLLLDQTFGRQEGDYRSLTPERCKKLLGTNYALLRPEFDLLRKAALEKRERTKSIDNILVFVGGSDVTNLTGAILDVVQRLEWGGNKPHINVVLGAQSKNMEAVKALLSKYPLSVTLMSNVENMAELMKEADLSIGAGGATAWERCSLGLPTLMKVLSDNQRGVAEALNRVGAVSLWHNEQELETELEALMSVGDYWFSIKNQAQQVCDANGAKRTMEAIRDVLVS